MSAPRLVIAVPARDEAERIPRALRAIAAARDHLVAVEPAARVTLVVAADGCTDTTSSLARLAGVAVVETSDGVGAARGAAIRVGLALDPQACWIVNTDADSVVPPHWLIAHVAAERAGVDVLLGSIRPDAVEAGPHRYAQWLALERPQEQHDHVHGANLGVRTSVYRSVGGFPEWDVDEDVALVARCRAAGARVLSTDRAPVITSARLDGRTAGGLAGWFRATARP